MGKKLLITGRRRSGTTFLANFLNAQEDFLIYRDFLRRIFSESKKLGIKSFKNKLTEREKNVILSNLKAEYLAAGENVEDVINRDKFSDIITLFEKSLRLLNKKNKKIVGVKCTEQEHWIPDLLESGDVYIIYVYRDIRDILLSSKNRFSDYKNITYLINIKENIERVMSIQDEKLLKIKFEDLILNPDNAADKISEFLEVKITTDIKKAKDRGGSKFIDNSSFHDINKLFDEKACYRWKKHLNSKEVKYSEILMPNLIKKLGYELDGNYGYGEKIAAYREFYIQKSINYMLDLVTNIRDKI